MGKNDASPVKGAWFYLSASETRDRQAFGVEGKAVTCGAQIGGSIGCPSNGRRPSREQ